MSTEKPDLWFSFVRSHRALIREVDPGGHPKCPTYGHPNCSTRLGVT